MVFLGSNKGRSHREYGYDFTEEDFAYISQFNLIYTNLNSYIEDDLKSLKGNRRLPLPMIFPPDGRTRIWRRCARMSRVAILSCAHFDQAGAGNGWR